MFRSVARPLFWLTVALGIVAVIAACIDTKPSRRAAGSEPTLPLPSVAQSPVVARTAAVPLDATSTNDDNPRVEPGLVRWHSSFADAKIAAQRSGKPVLLFHMMGQLDRQFC